MDLNSSENGEKKMEEPSQNSAPVEPEKKAEHQNQTQKQLSPLMQKMISGEKIHMPKLKMPNFKEKFAEYGRVLKVTKKPDSEEFKAIVKASGLGIIVIGMVGFIIAIIVQLIQMIG